VIAKYWQVDKGQRGNFCLRGSTLLLYKHIRTPIRRYVTMQSSRGPYDGNWIRGS